MAKSKKVQVTLEEVQYEELAEIAQRKGRKLASIVRESIEQYALAPEADRSKREALEDLFALDPAPGPPDDYEAWKREYGGRKTKSQEKD